MMLQNACIRYDKTIIHKPSTTSRAVYQHEVDADPDTHDEEDSYLDDNLAPVGIDTPSDDMYNIHNTNFKRNPQVKSLVPRKPPRKSKPNKAIPPEPGYNGPVCLPKHIYNNQDKKAQYKPNCSRMAQVHEQDHEEVEDRPDHPEPDLEKQFHEESYPTQDSDIEDLLETYTPYTVNGTFTYHISKHDRNPSTNPGAEPPRDARDSGSARSHSTHLETSSSDRP